MNRLEHVPCIAGTRVQFLKLMVLQHHPGVPLSTARCSQRQHPHDAQRGSWHAVGEHLLCKCRALGLTPERPETEALRVQAKILD